MSYDRIEQILRQKAAMGYGNGMEDDYEVKTIRGGSQKRKKTTKARSTSKKSASKKSASKKSASKKSASKKSASKKSASKKSRTGSKRTRKPSKYNLAVKKYMKQHNVDLARASKVVSKSGRW